MSEKDKIAGHAEVSEKALERRLAAACSRRGWLCLKYSNMQQAGYPDRIIAMPGGRVAWVEVKSRGRRPTPLQARRHRQLRELGHHVFVIDSREELEALLLWLED